MSDRGTRITQQTWEFRGSFIGTWEQADEVKRTMEALLAVYFDPTADNARVLFEQGARAVVMAAQIERDQ